MNNIETLKKAVELIQNYNDPEKIKSLMTDLITQDYGFSVVGIFDVNGDFVENAVISGSSKLIDEAARVLGTPLSKLKFSLNSSDNIFAKSVKSGKFSITSNVEDFLPELPIPKGILKLGLKALMKLYGVNELAIFPCFYKSELYSCIIVGNRQSFSQEQIDVLRLLSDQLASYLSFATLTRSLEKKVDELSESLRKERDMLDVLGHELRTPISIVRNAIKIEEIHLTALGLLPSNTDILKDKLRENENISRTIDILERILNYSDIAKGRVKLELVEINCIDIVQASVDSLINKAKKHNLELKFNTPSENLSCKADKKQLQIVINNLIDNAIKYTKEGSIILSLEDSMDEIKFIITDTGVGIPEEQIPNLGKTFFKIGMYYGDENKDGIDIVRDGGTGLGLFIVMNLLKYMNGKLDIKSEINKGSVFTAILPKYNQIL